MTQITAILAIFYISMIILDFFKTEKHWEEIQRDSEEEK